MRTILKPAIALIILTASMSGCMDKTIERVTYTANVPVYMSFTDFRTSFRKSAPVEISHPGKIYFKDGYLFVNEVGKGIHVIDNSNPANPKKIAFYDIVGNVDIAISGNILFADSYIDLVSIDITDINNPREVGRLRNIFPEVVPEGDMWYPYARVDKSKGVIVDWKVETVTEEREPGSYTGGLIFRGEFMFMASSDSRVAGNLSSGAGTGGSMARFMLNEDCLYLIAHPWMLKTVNIEKAEKMKVIDSVNVSRTIETLYKMEEKLFIGTTTGMLIFNLVNKTQPRQIASYNHITACDPVVVDGKYAYVTLRTGTRCTNGQNLLEVIDISSITNPYLVKSYPMFNPYGLGTDGNLLFVCDGKAGLKVYDKTDPMAIITNQLAHYPDFDTFDVIPMDGVLMLVGEGGIYQYDYSDPLNIVQISHIVIVKDE
jgi:hypothetical protein